MSETKDWGFFYISKLSIFDGCSFVDIHPPETAPNLPDAPLFTRLSEWCNVADYDKANLNRCKAFKQLWYCIQRILPSGDKYLVTLSEETDLWDHRFRANVYNKNTSIFTEGVSK